MQPKPLFCLLIVLGMTLAACASNTPMVPSPVPTEMIKIATNPLPSVTPSPSSTAIVAVVNTATNTPLSTATIMPSPSSSSTNTATNTPLSTATIIPTPSSSLTNASNYIDDRSTPITLITSYFNAITRKEYLRAYSYWSDPSTSLGTLTAFTNGYADTASIDAVFGTITSGAGAGQIYYTVPVVLKGIATNGQQGNYAACYVVHLSRPENFGEPPIQPMGIDRGTARSISLMTSDVDALAGACTGPDYPVNGPVTIPASTLNIDASNYLDNRSGPIETVSSYLNALNSKQYVRAYSYWQNAASTVGSYDAYANGFANTAAITVTFGTFSSDVGAGQQYYKVSLAMKVQTTSNTTQTLVGCYTLHLAQPAAQGVYPFQPMGITAGKFTQYNNTVDVNSLLTSACQ